MVECDNWKWMRLLPLIFCLSPPVPNEVILHFSLGLCHCIIYFSLVAIFFLKKSEAVLGHTIFNLE